MLLFLPYLGISWWLYGSLEAISSKAHTTINRFPGMSPEILHTTSMTWEAVRIGGHLSCLHPN